MPASQLPPEAIARILSLATRELVGEERLSPAGTTVFSTVTSFLRSTSLVHSIWRPIAQELLFSNALLNERNLERYFERLEEVGCRGWVRRVFLGPLKGSSAPLLDRQLLVARLVEELPSLEELETFECVCSVNTFFPLKDTGGAPWFPSRSAGFS